MLLRSMAAKQPEVLRNVLRVRKFPCANALLWEELWPAKFWVGPQVAASCGVEWRRWQHNQHDTAAAFFFGRRRGYPCLTLVDTLCVGQVVCATQKRRLDVA